MKNIISFKTAKILSEFEYNKPCKFSFDEDGLLTANAEQLGNFKACELSDVKKYLKTNYNINIYVDSIIITTGCKFGKRFIWSVSKNKTIILSDKTLLGFIDKQQALDAAIFETLIYLKNNEINI